MPKKTRESSISGEQEGTVGRARVRKAAVQQAAGRFLDQLLRHKTVVRRTLRTGLALPAAAWGLSLYLSGSSPSPRTQNGQLALSVTR